MQGTVRKRGNKWYYRYSITLDGKRKYVEKVGGKTKKECLEALNKEIYQINTGNFIESKDTLKNFLEMWLDEYVKNEKKYTTYEKYFKCCTKYIYPVLGDIEIKNIKVLHIEKYLKYLQTVGLSNTSRQVYYGVLRGALNKAVKLQLINENPCKFVDSPKRNKYNANILEMNEFNLIYNNLNEEDLEDYLFKLALDLTIETGLRRGEMCGLCWKDIDFKEKTISINKTLSRVKNTYNITATKTEDSNRILPVSDFLIDRFADLDKKQKLNKLKYGENYIKNIFNGKEYNLIFKWANGSYVKPATFLQRLKRLLALNNINKNIRWHDLRHTNATMLLSAGVDFKTLQERLGHSLIGTTMNIYAHVTKEMNTNATNIISDLIKKEKMV